MEVSPDFASAFPTKEDFLRELLSTSPSFASLSAQITTTTHENVQLRQHVQELQLQLLSLQSKQELLNSQQHIHDLSLSERAKTLEQQFSQQYTTKLTSLEQQIALLQQQHAELNEQHGRLQNVYETSQIYLESVKTAYITRAQQLYLQLHKYQAADSVKIAKEQVELNSRAYLVIDKLGSQLHLDTIQQRQHGNTQLVNVTQTTQSLASKGEHSEVLCTRDQVRLVLTGKLHDLQAFGDIRWYRSQHGSQFLQIPNAGGRSRANASVQETYGASMVYVPTVDDLYCTLRCQFVDPVTGATLVTEIGPVVPDKDLLDCAVDGYKRGELEQSVAISDSDVDMLIENELKFEKMSKEEKKKDKGGIDKGMSQNNINVSGGPPNFLESLGMGGGGGTMGEFKLTLSNKKILITGKRTTTGKKVTIKHVLDPSIYIAAHSDTETGFSIYLYNNWVNCAATTRHQRDIILALTRLYTQQSRINDIANESEKLREKQYSSAWMLSLINNEHDTVCSMPKSKIATSQMISITAEELNVGNLLLGPKMQQCGYADSECFIDVLQTPFPTIMDVLKEDTDVSGAEANDHNAQTTPPPATPANECVWVTRKEFEHNAILHTQMATLDQDPHKKKQFAGRPASSLSPGFENRSSFSLSHHSFTSDAHLASVSRAHLETSHSVASAPPLHQDVIKKTSSAVKLPQAGEEYVPYDIDDVTPQLGQGKRGFDDIVIGGDSDDDDEAGPHGAKTSRHVDGQSGPQGEHGTPLFEIKIKTKEEVQVDTAANTAKIKQIFTKNPLLGLNQGGEDDGAQAAQKIGPVSRRGRHSSIVRAPPSGSTAGLQPPTPPSTLASPTSTTSNPQASSQIFKPRTDIASTGVAEEESQAGHVQTAHDHVHSVEDDETHIVVHDASKPPPSPPQPTTSLPPIPTHTNPDLFSHDQDHDHANQPVVLDAISPIRNGKLFDDSDKESSPSNFTHPTDARLHSADNHSVTSIDFVQVSLTQIAKQAEMNKDYPQVSFEIPIEAEHVVPSSLVDDSDDEVGKPNKMVHSADSVDIGGGGGGGGSLDDDADFGEDIAQGGAIDESKSTED